MDAVGARPSLKRQPLYGNQSSKCTCVTMPLGRRKPSGSPSTRPRRPKRRQNAPEESQPSTSTAHSEESDISVITSPAEPHCPPSYASLCKLEIDLHARFSSTKIEVDSLSATPLYAWILDSKEEYATDNNKIKISRGGDAIPPEYKEKWTGTGEDIRARAVNFIQSEINDAAESLTYSITQQTWSCDFQKSEEKAKEKWVKEKKVKQKDKSLEGDEEVKDEFFKYSKSFPLMSFSLCQSFISAFVHRMSNGKGQRLVNSLLEVASLICFGSSRFHHTVLSGASESQNEGFPVSLVNYHTNEDSEDYIMRSRSLPDRDLPEWAFEPDELPAPPTRRKSSRGASDVPGSARGSTPCTSTSVSCVSEANVEGAPGIIYPDSVVACVDKSSFSKYVLIADVTSSCGPLSDAERGQIYREMLGAGVHQTEVFGLLINSVEASILRMAMSDNGKLIKFAEASYDFTPIEGSQFNAASFCNFFRDLTAVLDCGDKKIAKFENN